ncbi:MAG TPA: hypothetical protein VIY29_01695, partial [Ktedonobacteraceae bacterium]
AAELAVAGVVQHNHQHVGRARPGAQRLGPGRAGLVGRQPDDAGEGGSGFVLFEWHVKLLHINRRVTITTRKARGLTTLRRFLQLGCELALPSFLTEGNEGVQLPV